MSGNDIREVGEKYDINVYHNAPKGSRLSRNIMDECPCKEHNGCERKLIYQVNSFENKTDLEPGSIMYFLHKKEIAWTFDRCPNREDFIRVDVVEVKVNSNSYKSACANSAVHED